MIDPMVETNTETKFDLENLRLADAEDINFEFQNKDEFPPEWTEPSSIEAQLKFLKEFANFLQINSESDANENDAEVQEVPGYIEKLREKLTHLESNKDQLSQQELVVTLYLIKERLEQFDIQGSLPRDVVESFSKLIKIVEDDRLRQVELVSEASEATSPVEVVETQLETLNIDGGENLDIERVVDAESGEDALVVKTGDSEAKVVGGQLLMALLVVVISDSVFKTNHLSIMMEEVGELAGKTFMGVLGFPSEVAKNYSEEAAYSLINKAETGKLFNFLKELSSQELTNFIIAMNPEDAALLMTGHAFGNYSRHGNARHSFNEFQSGDLLGKISKDQFYRILRRFDARGVELFFEKLSDEDKRAILAGEGIGPRKELALTSEQLNELLGPLSSSTRNSILGN